MVHKSPSCPNAALACVDGTVQPGWIAEQRRSREVSGGPGRDPGRHQRRSAEEPKQNKGHCRPCQVDPRNSEVTFMTIVQFPGASIDLTEVQERFAAAMQQRGLIPPHGLIADGKIHRCDVRGKGGKNDGSYLLSTTGKLPAGGFQNFTDGLGWQKWHHDVGRQHLTPVEQREIQEKQAAAARERIELEKLEIAAAAQRAHNIWSRTGDVAGHGYLAAKQIATSGARVMRGALVIPARTIDGELRGLQFIAADGKKRFMKGSRPSGAFHQVGGDRSISEDTGGAIDTVVICEGFATAATIHQATGYITLAAFSCGNLQTVAEAVRRKYPDTKIIIGADDDHGTKGNPGIYAALDAALAVDGLLASPGFDQPLAAGMTDFNDLALSRGLDSVRKAIKAAGTPAEVLERRLLQDPFRAFDAESIKAVVKLKERDQSAFERLRQRLKQKGARTSELDKLWGRAAISDIDGVERAALKQADILVKLAGAAHLFHTRDGTAYADITVADHRETCAIYSRDFKRWLKHRYYEQTESSPASETFT